MKVTRRQLRQIIREAIISEIVRKRDCKTSKGKKGKYVLLRKKKPHKKLGCHKTKKKAYAQEKAIKASGG
jgi:uncharacterized protein YwbE|tara:strand:+ start:368 stop:577 length:210 start_codon:yes stop_codon:yes gene_type:complete